MNISKHSGYTLVELMVTIGIIGTLAAIAVPSYNGYIELANNASCPGKCRAAGDVSGQLFLREWFIHCRHL